jgi:uncharacterized protein YcaQ
LKQTTPAEKTYPAARLRRLALDSQGLLKNAPFGKGKGAVLKAIEHIGYVQIDTISVVERAHHHVLRARVPNYQPAHLARLIKERKVFEYWYHAAAFLPMRDFAHARVKMEAMRRGEDRWIRCKDTALMKRVLDHVRAEGPARARDFENKTPENAEPGWWNWNPTKRALEQLFMQGDLMITDRSGFQKTYDLTERVLPSDISTKEPTLEDHAAYLVDTTLRAHGFATLKSFTHLRRGTRIRNAVRYRLDDLVAAGEVLCLKTADGSTWYALAESLEGRAAPAAARVKILSPFDNSVILRHRGAALFDFDYQIECYVKEQDRKFGYFCLPLVYRDHMVGRIDAKAHRERGELALKSIYIERPVDDGFGVALAEAVRDFATFNNCTRVTIGRIEPKDHSAMISAPLRALEESVS